MVLALLPPFLHLTTPPSGLAGSHQKSNASLSLALLSSLLASPSVPSSFAHFPRIPKTGSLPPAIKDGLERARWPGRCQLVREPKEGRRWWLDGAHTVESLEGCGLWFWDEVKKETKGKRFVSILLFVLLFGKGHSGVVLAWSSAKKAQLPTLTNCRVLPSLLFAFLFFLLFALVIRRLDILIECSSSTALTVVLLKVSLLPSSPKRPLTAPWMLDKVPSLPSPRVETCSLTKSSFAPIQRMLPVNRKEASSALDISWYSWCRFEFV